MAWFIARSMAAVSYFVKGRKEDYVDISVISKRQLTLSFAA